MVASSRGRRWTVIGEMVLALLLLSGSGCGLSAVFENPSRVLGQRFVHALETQTETVADAYLTPDVQVYLQGARTPLSRGGFSDYLAVMKRGQRVYQAGSPVFSTPSGAGWLLQISALPGTAGSYESDAPRQPPQLWMEAKITADRITRLWIHFTMEALPRLGIDPDAYRAAAARQGMQVPEGWSGGTPALLAAAERGDRLADGGWMDSTRQVAIVVVTLLAAGLMSLAGRSWRQRHLHSVDMRERGELLARLRDARSVRSGPL